jgi:hypothetical protein
VEERQVREEMITRQIGLGDSGVAERAPLRGCAGELHCTGSSPPSVWVSFIVAIRWKWTKKEVMGSIGRVSRKPAYSCECSSQSFLWRRGCRLESTFCIA